MIVFARRAGIDPSQLARGGSHGRSSSCMLRFVPRARTWERRVESRVSHSLIERDHQQVAARATRGRRRRQSETVLAPLARESGERTQLPEQEEQRHRDRELSNLDAEVEGDQRTDDRRAAGSQADVLERAREAEAMKEVTRERQQPALPSFAARRRVSGSPRRRTRSWRRSAARRRGWRASRHPAPRGPAWPSGRP